MDVFRQFTNVTYKFFVIAQGVEGNTIAQRVVSQELENDEYTSTGVFKFRDGILEEDNIENFGKVNATLHIRPGEPFLTIVEDLVGHGIEYDGVHYRITTVKEGMDFDTGRLHFYKLDLKREDIASWQETPLE